MSYLKLLKFNAKNLLITRSAQFITKRNAGFIVL